MSTVDMNEALNKEIDELGKHGFPQIKKAFITIEQILIKNHETMTAMHELYMKRMDIIDDVLDLFGVILEKELKIKY